LEISKSKSFAPPELDYDAMKTEMHPLAQRWDIFFDNNKPTICPLTKCSLMNNGVPYTGKNLKIGEAAPF